MLGNSLTPGGLTNLLFERNTGDLQGWIDLANEARRKDPHLHSQLSIREQSVVETDFAILPGKDAQRRGNVRAARKAVAACEELYESWKTIGKGGWERWLAEIVAGNYYGRSVHEVLWDRVDGDTIPVALERVHERRLSYACDLADPNPWALRLWDKSDFKSPFGGLYGVPIAAFHPDKFLINEPRVAGGMQSEEGLFAIVVWYWLFRTWSWRDLMALLEMSGRPPVIAYYAAGGARLGKENEMNGARNASPTEVDTARRVVRQLTGALRAALPDTLRLEALKTNFPQTPLQVITSQEIDRLESKAINGSTGVSDIVAGARASHEVGERTSYTFWRADCRNVARLISWLFGRYIRANPKRFGENCPLPVFKALTDPPKDRVAILEAVERGQRIGMKIPRKWTHEESGIPQADADAKPEDLLQPVPAKTQAVSSAANEDRRRDEPNETPPDLTEAKD